MQVLIRAATPGEAPGIVSVFNPIIDEARTYTLFDTPFTVEAECAYILGPIERDIFHVAVRGSDNTIVGFQPMAPIATYTQVLDHVGVSGTYVDLGYRRQGIASRLFPVTLEAARQRGHEKIFTYILESNAATFATDQSHGFRIFGTAERHAKLHGRYVDGIVVERLLD